MLKHQFRSQLFLRYDSGRSINGSLKRVHNLEDLHRVEAEFEKWTKINQKMLQLGFTREYQVYMEQYKKNEIFLGHIDDKKESSEYRRKRLSTILPNILDYLQDLINKIPNLPDEIFNIIPDNIETIDNPINKTEMKRVFISHATDDSKYAEEVIGMLIAIGVNRKEIFCSSVKGYGVELGENFLERLKTELKDDPIVIFLLSHSFYKRPVCLCEMGASWIQTTTHIPITIPPFTHKNIDGVLPNTTVAMPINDTAYWNDLNEKITRECGLDHVNTNMWERERDRQMVNINRLIPTVTPV